jgi:nitrogen fixation protein FixH
MAVQRKPGWWYPYIFVAGFMVVLLVNFTMAYFATSTFSGLSTESPYEKGLAYNKVLEESRRQDDLGWQVTSQVEPGANHGAQVTVRFKDKDGKPIDDLAVRAQMVRPTAKGHDRDVPLARTEAGTYATIQELPMAGVWDMTVTAKSPSGPSYALARRILVP